MTVDLRVHSATGRGLMLAAAATVYLLSPAAQAGAPEVFDCGGEPITGENGNVTIGADIGPCTESPALTIEGPVKVNFNGHKVICATKNDDDEEVSINGIEVTGHDATLQNGIVKNCDDAIDVMGDGRHKLIRMVVTSNQSDVGNRGFRVRSDNNYLALDVALRFNGEGFRIEGDQNRLIRNTSTHNQNHGFRGEGNDNILTNNLARRVGSQENGGEGFRVNGTGNRLLNNIALKSQDEGFRIREAGQDNTLIHNIAQGNGVSDGEAGIRIQGSGNQLTKNAFLGNAGDGILVTKEAGNNSIDRNTTRDNSGDGIRVEEIPQDSQDAGNNSIDRNMARDNGGTDLVDENMDPPCDDNSWTRNRFDTRSQDCIQ